MKHARSLAVLKLLFALVLLAITSAATASAAPPATASSERPSCFTTGWPHDGSDLTSDPDLRFGQLDNGLRYVLMVNREPRDRVAMYLNVQAGSLRETDDQRGVAHFLEHMLFNGTTHYPPGTLVEYFQSIGMGFGADTNAHTSFDETVYNLFLPSGKPEVLAEGFKVLADYARGGLLLEKEVDRERGVILAEKRSRDSAESRVGKEQLRFDFAGTLVAERDPIGTEEVIIATDSRLLRNYYDYWYRPENIIVVVVGDMSVEETERLLRERFAPLTAAGPTGDCAEIGRVGEEGVQVLFFPEPELGYTGLTLNTIFNVAPQADTQLWQAEQLRRYLGTSLLNNRLQQLERQPGSPLTSSRVSGGIFLEYFGYAGLTARVEAAKWQQGLGLLQTALGQALRDGFSEAELARVKGELRAQLDKAVQTASSRDSGTIARDLIRKLNCNEVPRSPEQDMELFGPLLERMTLAEATDGLRRLWAGGRRNVEVVGTVPVDLAGEGVEERIRKVYAEHAARPVKAWVAEEQAPFPYLPVPASDATIVAQTTHKDIDARVIDFKGGVRLNTKTTDFDANQVLVAIHFGQGRQTEPAEGMAVVAETVVRESGVGKLTREQLEAALAGTNIKLGFRAGAESFVLTGSALTGELELLLQLAYAQLHDPAFRTEALARGHEQLHQMYEQMGSSVEGTQQLRGERFLGGGGHEYGLPAWTEVEQVTLTQVDTWLRPIFATAPLEINIVGDIDPQEAARLVARHFGAEKRVAEAPSVAASLAFPTGEQCVLTVPSAIDKAQLTVAWKIGDYWDIGRTRRFNVLAAVLGDRLRVQVREELGAAYSPRVFSQPSRTRPNFGLLQASLTIAPDQAEALARIIVRAAAELGEKGVSAEELQRSIEPTLTAIRDARRTNRYWLDGVLSLSSRHGEQLSWPQTITRDFAAISVEELTALAAAHLRAEQAAVVIVRPKSGR
ncbi:MAG: insulinase family protein [Desulfobulbus sp.]|jgi:zinc protease|nr:insulinase family protein [Desulfobulbus sp.]